MANHILIGIGGTGYNVLREFRKRMWEEIPDMTLRNRKPVRFLYIDSDEGMAPARLAGNDNLRVKGQDTAITPAEYLGIKNVNLNAIFDNPAGFPGLRYVVENSEFVRTCIGEVGQAAGQKRRAGRILFASNIGAYNQKIDFLINDLQHTIGNANDLNIYVFAGLAGGTGSGSIVDATAQLITRHPEANVEVFAMLPEELAPNGADAGRYHANGYAAISELSALNVGAFLPSDVSNGNKNITPDAQNAHKRFGLSVYTNKNRNGAIVDSFNELPKIVADVMYFRIFNEETDEMRALNRYFRSENRPNFLAEYKTNTREGAPVEPARTKATGSFGIKRLRYPSERLTLHASESVSKVIMGMMLYLNYDNDRGFVLEAPAQARDYGEYLNKANLKNWKLHDSDLSLSTPILKPANGKNPPSFNDFWENEVALDYSYKAAKQMGQPLQIAAQYFDERYRGEFREERGVEAYFQAKANHQVVTDSAAAIVDHISINLFNQWLQGAYSAYDIKRITERILELLQAKYQGMDGEIVALDETINKCVDERHALEDEYRNVGVIINVLKRSKENIYLEYTNVLAEEYTARTRRESLSVFQKVLLPRLIQMFTDLQLEIQRFVGRLDETVREYEALITSNTPESIPDLRKAMIEVADLDRLRRFERDLLLDREKMKTMAQAMRNHIAQNAGNSFSSVTNRIANPNKLEEASHAVLDELIQAYHAEMMRREPVLGLNVLEQLYEMFGNDDDALGRFASDLVANSEVYISLNDQEVNRALRNNTGPNEVRAAGPNCILLVAIPGLETDDEDKRAFVNRLNVKIRNAYNASDTRQFYIYESPRKDEITVMAYENLFPARAISYMPFLKQRYEALTQSGNRANDKANRILLHVEGDGTQLPPLFGENEGPRGDEVIKYLFHAVALGILKTGENELGLNGFGLVTTDFAGIETFTLLSPKFTEILTAPDFTPEVKNDLIEKVDKKIAEPRHVRVNKEAADAIINVMRNFVFPEAGSPTSPLYRRYSDQAQAALETFR